MRTNKNLSLLSAALMTTMTCLSPIAAADDEVPWYKTLSVEGLVEFEAFTLDSDNGDESDADLATVELHFSADINDSVGAYVSFLIEAPDHDFELDEAGIEFDLETWSINLGKQYVPFGAYESFMISDPLTLEIGETNEEAALFGFGSDALGASIYLFDGDVDETGSDDSIDNFGLSLTAETDGIVFGLDYINSLADSDGIGDALAGTTIADYPAGYAVYAVGTFGAFTVIGEAVAANDEFMLGGAMIEPSAYNVEFGYEFETAGMPSAVAIAFQGTDEAVGLELPETAILVSYGFEPYENVGVTFEYQNQEDYEVGDGGTGNDADIFTIQVSASW